MRHGSGPNARGRQELLRLSRRCRVERRSKAGAHVHAAHPKPISASSLQPPLVPPFSFLVPCARCVGGACRTCRACCACCTDRAICLHANTLCRTRALCCASLPRVCPCLGTRAQSRECPVNAVLPVLCTRVCVSVCARRCLLSVCQHPHECVGGCVGGCVCARARRRICVGVFQRMSCGSGSEAKRGRLQLVVASAAPACLPHLAATRVTTMCDGDELVKSDRRLTIAGRRGAGEATSRHLPRRESAYQNHCSLALCTSGAAKTLAGLERCPPLKPS